MNLLSVNFIQLHLLPNKLQKNNYSLYDNHKKVDRSKLKTLSKSKFQSKKLILTNFPTVLKA